MKYPFSTPKILIPVFLLLLLASVWTLNRLKPQNVDSVSNEQLQVASAKEKVDLNREFQVPILDNQDQEVTKIKYFIQNAEKQDEIIVAGQKAVSVKGKTFLIVNLKLTNDFNKTITLNSRDFIRLILNNNAKEQIAPEIHNDPVEIQAISTKYTRVGFTINDTDQNMILKVGEINNSKTDLILPFLH